MMDQIQWENLLWEVDLCSDKTRNDMLLMVLNGITPIVARVWSEVAFRIGEHFGWDPSLAEPDGPPQDNIPAEIVALMDACESTMNQLDAARIGDNVGRLVLARHAHRSSGER